MGLLIKSFHSVPVITWVICEEKGDKQQCLINNLTVIDMQSNLQEAVMLQQSKELSKVNFRPKMASNQLGHTHKATFRRSHNE